MEDILHSLLVIVNVCLMVINYNESQFSNMPLPHRPISLGLPNDGVRGRAEIMGYT